MHVYFRLAGEMVDWITVLILLMWMMGIWLQASGYKMLVDGVSAPKMWVLE
jgi:hypothetical protein